MTNIENVDPSAGVAVCQVNNSDGKIETDIYYKDTNSHDYLHYNSHHPEHVKNNTLK